MKTVAKTSLIIATLFPRAWATEHSELVKYIQFPRQNCVFRELCRPFFQEKVLKTVILFHTLELPLGVIWPIPKMLSRYLSYCTCAKCLASTLNQTEMLFNAR
jgi:hypothetical protein